MCVFIFLIGKHITIHVLDHLFNWVLSWPSEIFDHILVRLLFFYLVRLFLEAASSWLFERNISCFLQRVNLRFEVFNKPIEQFTCSIIFYLMRPVLISKLADNLENVTSQILLWGRGVLYFGLEIAHHV